MPYNITIDHVTSRVSDQSSERLRRERRRSRWRYDSSEEDSFADLDGERGRRISYERRSSGSHATLPARNSPPPRIRTKRSPQSRRWYRSHDDFHNVDDYERPIRSESSPSERSVIIIRKDGRNMKRQGTTDWESRKPTRRIRYTIPLRSKKRIGDEENIFSDSDNVQLEGRGRLMQDIHHIRGSQHLDIVSAHCMPDEDDRETVSLTVADKLGQGIQEKVHSASRWRHISNERPMFGQLYEQATVIGGLGNDDLAVVARLLNKVQKTCEKKYIHGRYLKPITIVYDGEDPTNTRNPQMKTATFLSLPVFWLENLREEAPRAQIAGHPSRALLQSRYRLESTVRREKQQVITTVMRNEGCIVHVPQIWVLIINRHTIITCAPIKAAALCGSTIKTVSYADAQADEALWSIHLHDTDGGITYLPLRSCTTWFALVRSVVSTVHPNYMRHRVQDDLLNGTPSLNAEPSCRLSLRDGATVNAGTWSSIIDAKKAEVIHLTLDCSMDSNPKHHARGSPSQPEISPSLTSSEGEGDRLDDPLGSDYARPGEPAQETSAIRQLRRLQDRLCDATLPGGDKSLFELEQMQMPALEALVYELTSGTPQMEARPRPGFVSISFLRQLGPRSRTKHHGILGNEDTSAGEQSALDVQSAALPDSRDDGVDEHSERMHGDEQGEGMQEEGTENLQLALVSSINRGSTPDVDDNASTEGQDEYGKRYSNGCLKVNDDSDFQSDNNADSRPKIDYSEQRRAVSRTRLHAKNPRRPPQQASHILIQRQELPALESAASQRRISLSRLDLKGNPDRNGRADRSIQKPLIKDDESPDIYYQPTDRQIDLARHELRASHDERSDGRRSGISHTSVRQDTENFIGLSQEKPRVKKLLKLARQEVRRALKVKKPTIPEWSMEPVEKPGGQCPPVFLWSTESPTTGNMYESSAKVGTFDNGKQRINDPDEGPERLSRAICKYDELMLHAILGEAHAKLRKSEGVSPPERETAILYEVVEHKTESQVALLLLSLRAENKEITKEDEKNGQHAERGSTKEVIHDLAVKILHAFVPEDCEGPVIGKFWGCVYELLAETSVERLHRVSLRLKELWLLTRDIQMGVQTDDGSKLARFHIPRALPAAFQQLVVFLVVSSNTSLQTVMEMKFEDCRDLLIEGRKQLILMVHTLDFKGRAGFEAVDSEALLAFILFNLTSKLSDGGDCDLTEMYSQYTLKLQRLVRDRASVKVYDKIKLLQEEVDVIKSVLAQQDTVLQDFRSVVGESRNTGSLSVTVIDRMLESIGQRIEDFDELHEQADTARYLAAQSISLKAENNSKAILVFTITTITFLPLSFVTSYLGMNTSDLRTMKSGQTLFWIVGAPLAFVILGLALVAAFSGSLQQRVWRAMGMKEKHE